MTVYYTFTESPIQQLMLTSDGEALIGLRMIEHRHAPVMTEAWRLDDNVQPFAEAKRQLAAYFNGELTEFDLPLNLQGTNFQQIVWRELQKIPFGQTMSYGQMAQHIGNPNGSRAVGAANGRNPVSIIIPCHRLIGSDGKLTDYGGGLERKEWLLAHESRYGSNQSNTKALGKNLHDRHQSPPIVRMGKSLLQFPLNE